MFSGPVVDALGVYKDPSGRFGGLGLTTSAYIMRKLMSTCVEITLELPMGRQPQWAHSSNIEFIGILLLLLWRKSLVNFSRAQNDNNK